QHLISAGNRDHECLQSPVQASTYSNMKTVLLPNTDLRVSQLCLGSTDIGSLIPPDASFALLDLFVSLGGNFIDTAHVYANWLPGFENSSEKTIGRWLKARSNRDQIVLSTKGGHPS